MQRPPSNSSFTVNLSAGLCVLAAVMFLRVFAGQMDTIYAVLIVLFSGIVPLIIGEVFFLKTDRRPRVRHQEPLVINKDRVRIKLTAYYFSLILAAIFYSLVLVVYAPPAYQLFLQFFFLTFIVVCAFGKAYIGYMDARMPDPEDSLYHFGLVLCGKSKTADRTKVWRHLKSVLLRLFYAPSMMIAFVMMLSALLNGNISGLARGLADIPPDVHMPTMKIFDYLLVAYVFLAMIDVFFALIGYLMTFRILDADIRSTENTVFGWVICLICYQPFWMLLSGYLLYDLFHKKPWFLWFEGHDTLATLWGLFAIAGIMLESFSTMTFGIRFSNLTYRGLVTSGLFRFTKHPQYIGKMINRFAFYMPFMTGLGFLAGLKMCALLGLLAIIYYFRARTEENHLSRYPEYVAYAKWIDGNGIFCWMQKIHPSLSFNEERAKQGKLFPIGFN